MGAHAKISVSVDTAALDAIDRYVASHKGMDRSKLVDEALWLWIAAEQRRAMRAQFEPLKDEDERVLQAERAAWNAVRDEANATRFAGSG